MAILKLITNTEYPCCNKSIIPNADVEVIEFNPCSPEIMAYPLAWTQETIKFIEQALLKCNTDPKIIVNASAECPRSDKINDILNKYSNSIYIESGAFSIHARHFASSSFFGNTERYLNKIKITNFYTQFNTTTRNKYFQCLNRVPRIARIQFVNMLLEADLIKKGEVSLGADPLFNEPHFHKVWLPFVDTRYQHLMPLRVDNVTFDTQHELSPGSNAFINIVTESSTDVREEQAAWNRVFVTEKTIKAFVKKQLPMFVTVPEHVKFLRECGFDLFEDFIDHSYDTVIDPYARLHAVILELIRLCNLPLDIIRHFCQVNEHRFDNNINLSKTLGIQSHVDERNFLLNFLNT